MPRVRDTDRKQSVRTRSPPGQDGWVTGKYAPRQAELQLRLVIRFVGLAWNQLVSLGDGRARLGPSLHIAPDGHASGTGGRAPKSARGPSRARPIAAKDCVWRHVERPHLPVGEPWPAPHFPSAVRCRADRHRRTSGTTCRAGARGPIWHRRRAGSGGPPSGAGFSDPALRAAERRGGRSERSPRPRPTTWSEGPPGPRPVPEDQAARTVSRCCQTTSYGRGSVSGARCDRASRRRVRAGAKSRGRGNSSTRGGRS